MRLGSERTKIVLNKRLVRHALKLEQRTLARFRRQIVNQPLFRKFVERGELTGESPYALIDMLNTSPDAPKDVVSKKFTGLRSTAELVGDEEVLRFLDACVRAFPGLLTTDAAKRDERSKEE